MHYFTCCNKQLLITQSRPSSQDATMPELCLASKLDAFSNMCSMYLHTKLTLQTRLLLSAPFAYVQTHMLGRLTCRPQVVADVRVTRRAGLLRVRNRDTMADISMAHNNSSTAPMRSLLRGLASTESKLSPAVAPSAMVPTVAIITAPHSALCSLSCNMSTMYYSSSKLGKKALDSFAGTITHKSCGSDMCNECQACRQSHI